jgi:DNA-binding transcriptional LysR family regulator
MHTEMIAMPLNWDDLRFALAVASGGSLAAGGRLLGVNHTTVLRRMAALEKRLGAQLFERLPSGYALTPRGEELVEAARGIEQTVNRLETRLAGADLSVSGTIRVTTTDTLMVSLLPDILGELKAVHPGIEMEVTTSNLFLNLTRREADVAIRPADDPPPTLFGRRICSVGFAVFGRRGSLPGADLTITELALRPWIVPDDSLSATAAARWIATELPSANITARADSLVAMASPAETGLGLAALPCYLGDRSSKLMRFSAPVPAMQTGLWLLTHEHLRRTARIRTFMEFVGAALAKKRKVIEGV